MKAVIIVTTLEYPHSDQYSVMAESMEIINAFITENIQKGNSDQEKREIIWGNKQREASWLSSNLYKEEGLPIKKYTTCDCDIRLYVAPCLNSLSRTKSFSDKYLETILGIVRCDLNSMEDYDVYLIAHDKDLQSSGTDVYDGEKLSNCGLKGKYKYQHEKSDIYDMLISRLNEIDGNILSETLNYLETEAFK